MAHRLCFFEWLLLCHLLLSPVVVCSNKHGNPANELVDIINNNRSSQKLPKLNDSPGLGCMALQYVELCKGNCTSGNAVNCKPPEDEFTEVFAPNCGVELPTFGTITGHIVGCQSKYLEPSEAFSRVLVKDKNTLSLLRNKSHNEIVVKGSSRRKVASVEAHILAAMERKLLRLMTPF
ncbi:Ferredoxin-related [Melia azedarach]|uniref:Ferredoxin-related n=1 Tax=Melia azedarach TaxID=155640 RepID=A0ACC1YV29_MELAZ|nr:Ferredoxin-related [Melia azedarach]